MKILCVCYGNTCRSPMLQALLMRKLKGKNVLIESAGLADKSGAPASPQAIQCMKEMGVNITTHRSRKVSDLDLTSYDRIYCVEHALAQQLITSLGAPKEKIEVIEVSNPYGKDLNTYRACAKTLTQIAAVLARKIN